MFNNLMAKLLSPPPPHAGIVLADVTNVVAVDLPAYELKRGALSLTLIYCARNALEAATVAIEEQRHALGVHCVEHVINVSEGRYLGIVYFNHVDQLKMFESYLEDAHLG